MKKTSAVNYVVKEISDILGPIPVNPMNDLLLVDAIEKAQKMESDALTPFGESIKLLRDLADLQNGPPLEQHRKEWEKTMNEVYEFLNRWEEE